MQPQRISGHRIARICGRAYGLGKSTISAFTILWFALTRDANGVDWKAVYTAGAWRQLINYLSPEIHKWAGRIVDSGHKRAFLIEQSVKI